MKAISIILILLSVGLLVNCDGAEKIEIETVLDCTNLKIRKVIMMDNPGTFPGFRLTMENTCKLCDESLFHVYDSFYMIDKNSNDTIALCNCANLKPPPNKSSMYFDLQAKVVSLPNLENVQFVMYSTCLNIEYEPK